jgi:hypothetical protein
MFMNVRKSVGTSRRRDHVLRIKYGSVYDRAFFAGQVEQSLQSARVVARVIFRLFGPRSVVDVGCGLGA